MKMILLILTVLSLNACTMVQTPNGYSVPWIMPLPSGSGPAIDSPSGRGVNIYSGTVFTGGRSTGYSVVTGR